MKFKEYYNKILKEDTGEWTFDHPVRNAEVAKSELAYMLDRFFNSKKNKSYIQDITEEEKDRFYYTILQYFVEDSNLLDVLKNYLQNNYNGRKYSRSLKTDESSYDAEEITDWKS